MKNGLTWFPMHVDSWLFGSTRNELNPAQRGVFVDLLALSMKDEGYIRANADTPYPLAQLAGLLYLDIELLAETIEICIKVGKIARLENGTLRITSYEKYQLSRMTRWRAERRAEREPGGVPAAAADRPSSARGEDSKGENSGGRQRNALRQRRNTNPQAPDMHGGEGPSTPVTQATILSYRPSVEREIREAKVKQGLKGAELEAAVNAGVDAWERDMRRKAR